jgi:serine/threonine protein kinase
VHPGRAVPLQWGPVPTVTWNQPLEAAFEPTDLGPYRLVSRLGSGGFATVFKAIVRGELGFEREVALKLLHPGIIERNPGMTRALADEARLLGRLRHPNIVAAQWFGTLQPAEGAPVWALVMDYVEGRSWRSLLAEAAARGRPLPPAEIYDVHLGVARGLAYAHTLRDERGEPMGLVHRDLKPENVMVSTQGEVKLLDFGIAKARDRLADTTDSGSVRGTVSYMSPEQVRGIEVDFRSDYFALGTMLFEALTNLRLFQADEVVVSMYRIAHLRIDDALLPLHRVAPRAVPVLRSLLHPERDERFPSGEHLVAALEALQGGAVAGDRAHSALARRVVGQSDEEDVFPPPWDDSQDLSFDVDGETAVAGQLTSLPGEASAGSASGRPGREHGAAAVGPTAEWGEEPAGTADGDAAADGGVGARRRPSRAWVAVGAIVVSALVALRLLGTGAPGAATAPATAGAGPTIPASREAVSDPERAGTVRASGATAPETGPQPAASPTPGPAVPSREPPARAPTLPEPAVAARRPEAPHAATPAPTPTPAPPTVQAERAPPAPAASGPAATLQVAVPLTGRWELHVGGQAHDALEGRRGLSLPPGEHRVELRCHADCPPGEAVRTWDVSLEPGERRKLRL